ncbi:MAG: bifunctional phosphopantothenoylcysteine decarboxylase/phosphopantothenate--cysteine ligase CoaBC [Gammaproteobacteria bacterium]|nr:MAG: bifunctional phosphopantothenoylcysteine decarboxylase/phosphopantothenate--cysteine ligase CoaBC [Gammaproteobacteria bacterium]
MNSLINKQVVLGVTGGIAAYKSAELVRHLQKIGARVRVIMTPAAQEFITPLTLQALSGHPVHTELLDPQAEAAMGHIELARWADLILIAPASANFIARLCHGEGDDLLTTVCLASHCQIAVAPAMNQAMWKQTGTQENIAQLQARGVKIIGPAQGYQACGDSGPGRMEEPDILAKQAATLFDSGLLAGKKVVITAGPTREALDPVRYISNHSSGKMGYALATAAMEAGAETILISGPVNLSLPDRVEVVSVVSAQDMLAAALEAVEGADVFIAAAAVADYRPQHNADKKIKKTADDITIALTKNPDIVATIAALTNRPFTVGFAAETHNLENYARKKLLDKNLDLIIANDVSDKSIGFNSDDNQVTLVSPKQVESLPLMSKVSLAKCLIEYISTHLIA